MRGTTAAEATPVRSYLRALAAAAATARSARIYLPAAIDSLPEGDERRTRAKAALWLIEAGASELEALREEAADRA